MAIASKASSLAEEDLRPQEGTSTSDASAALAKPCSDSGGLKILRPLLEQAIRQSLLELARCAAHPHAGDSSGKGSTAGQSMESIVHDVAGRVLQEASIEAMTASLALGTAGGGEVNSCTERDQRRPSEPLLLDLKSTPWAVWREAQGSPRGQRRDKVCSLSGDEDWSATTSTTATTATLEGLDACSRQESQEESKQVSFSPGWRSCRPCEVNTSFDSLNSFQASPSSPRALISGNTLCDPMVVRSGLTIDSKSAQHLRMQWQQRPQAILVVAKPGDELVRATLQDMVAWLSSQGVTVILEPQLLADLPQQLTSSLSGLRTFSTADELEKRTDLVITIGGDGTLTWAVSLFRGAMPPVLSFAAGSLGFLTPYPLDSWVWTLTRLLDPLDMLRARCPLSLVCRMRLMVTVHRCGAGTGRFHVSDAEPLQVQCLNEVLVHRGQSGTLAKLDVGVDGEKVTLVQGDGLILATPTGSTAYSLAAGGSMVHPSVPAILLTPVSPHSLSFRPVVLPDFAVVTVGVPLTARCGAALSVDGKDICMLNLGDSVEVSMSPHPVPTICRATETGDWFASVHEALQWNRRAEQK
ncbi:unnamed protein product [Polarella glacialis]|uniref:NAD(+) kinase n=1 Tax=Polarella glacialis TaxID=89957 RepID=A0A813LCR2_POLGL|nr:unnamed protein product [Polarella glacialis]|mmetsp:Transcript_44226/g.71583  ORF Transcript_44226/g.71583 Transcript_44226/m.71583 type:complete len:583 (-) Transcript_44226:159-1907(-)